MHHRGPRDPKRTLGGQHPGVDDHKSRRCTVGDKHPARLQTVERSRQCVLAHGIIDDRHALAIGELADALGNVLARRHDRMRAAVRLGGFGFCIGADDADHGDAERLRPLAGDQAHATRRRVVEDRFATFKRVNLSEQILRRHPLHHQG
jgi:hypothetical protein